MRKTLKRKSIIGPTVAPNPSSAWDLTIMAAAHTHLFHYKEYAPVPTVVYIRDEDEVTLLIPTELERSVPPLLCDLANRG